MVERIRIHAERQHETKLWLMQRSQVGRQFELDDTAEHAGEGSGDGADQQPGARLGCVTFEPEEPDQADERHALQQIARGERVHGAIQQHRVVGETVDRADQGKFPLMLPVGGDQCAQCEHQDGREETG